MSFVWQVITLEWKVCWTTWWERSEAAVVGNAVTDIGLRAVTEQPNLSFLNLRDCNHITDDGLLATVVHPRLPSST